jgi:hypothetical protein
MTWDELLLLLVLTIHTAYVAACGWWIAWEMLNV